MAVYRDARDGQWRYRKTINLPDGRKLRISGTPPVSTKVGAEIAERKHIERALASLAGPTRKEVPAFETFAEEFLEKYVAVKNKPSELGTKRSILRHHLAPFFGAKKLDQIDAELIADYTSALLKTKKSPKTINNHLTVLRRTLAIAVKWGRLHRVPEIDWLKAPKPDFDFLDFSEAARLIEAAEGEWQTMILLALKTGLRQGELLALRWEDVDLVDGQLSVDARSRGASSRRRRAGRAREMPLLGRRALAALKASPAPAGRACLLRRRGADAQEGRLQVAAAGEHANGRDCGDIGWHVLRHTFASHLVMRSVPLKAVQELLGHATIEMTMRYTHLSPDVAGTRCAARSRPSPPDNRLTTVPGEFPKQSVS